MSTVYEEAKNIYRITGEPGTPLALFQSFLILDDKKALVEPGPSTFIRVIQEGLCRLGFTANSLSYIFTTHVHMYHAGGTGYLARLAPQAKVIVHQSGAKHLLQPHKLIEGARRAYGVDFENSYGTILPVGEENLVAVCGEETISLGKRELKVIHTPGHAPHHVCFYDRKSGGLFCGEALGVRFPFGELILPAAYSPRFDPQLALDSIAKLKKLKPTILFYGHFTVDRAQDRCFKLAEDSIMAVGKIILEIMRKNGSQEQITSRLEEYLGVRSYLASLPPAWVTIIHDIINWTLKENAVAYGTYFIEENMV